MTVALTAEDLRRSLDPADVPFESTAEIEPLDGMMSQPRAGEALELALGIEAPGYNLFATGAAGTGKRSVLEAELRRRAAARPAPRDWVYLHDFPAPTRPVAVSLPPPAVPSWHAMSPRWSRSLAAGSARRSSPIATASVTGRCTSTSTAGAARSSSGCRGLGDSAT